MKVSVVTVCKNAVASIGKTIDSVKKQKQSSDIEYIVIDGASTDGTMDILLDRSDVIDVLISERDKGIYDAMNKGTNFATGDIISFLNAGDIYSENAISNVVSCFVMNEPDVVYGHAIITHEGKQTHIMEADKDVFRIIVSMIACHQAVFITTKKQKKFGFGSRYKFGSDRELLIKIFLEGGRFCRLDSVLAFYDDSGLTSINKDFGIKENYCISYDAFNEYPYLKQDYKELYNKLIDEIYDYRICQMSTQIPESLKNYCIGRISLKNSVYIWGAGKYGKKAEKVMKSIGYRIKGFIDSSPDVSKAKNNVVYLPKEIIPKKNDIIVIAMRKHSEEVIKTINLLSNLRNIQWIVFTDFLVEYDNAVGRTVRDIVC